MPSGMAKEAPLESNFPKVLIMGDSISIGYTPYVKKLLQGKAEVIHHKGNAGPTIRGLKHIDQWLGSEKWDLIHFNFGLWDMYGWEYVKEDLSPAMYENRLETLVLRLQKTGAKLIWATTTPSCPKPEVSMRKRFNSETVIAPALEREYLDAALRVMKKHQIPLNDLHALILPNLKLHAVAPDNVHFKPTGRKILAKQVALTIEAALGEKNSKGKGLTVFSDGQKIGSSERLSKVTGMLVVSEEPLIVAHRGASRQAPENTLPAFKLAWKQEADAIEGDFLLTGDGQIVCIHDKDTRRVAGKKLVVAKSTLAELRQLDVGSYRGAAFKGTRIPTIAEVFATVPKNKKIYIEIKCGTEIIPALLKSIKKSGLKNDQIVVICFQHKVIQALKAKAPQFKANWLSSIKKDRSGKLIPSLESIFATLNQIKADGFSSSKNLIDETTIRAIMDKGYEHHVWTVDDERTAKRFMQWGTKSITTNVPGSLRSSLFKTREKVPLVKP